MPSAEWTELVLTVPRGGAAQTEAAAAAIAADGLYIEDYADLEQQVRAITHMDLIDAELLAKPRDVVHIHLYLPPGEDAGAAAALLEERLGGAGITPAIALRRLCEEDWADSWKQYYRPIELGRRLAVCPGWLSYESPGRTVLRMDPGMAFGTGTHESTALCLELLDEYVRGGEAILDVGCGSGILAVAALLLGARRALAVDIDPVAVRTAIENAQSNGVSADFCAKTGNLTQGVDGGPYQIITANIVADAILRLAPALPPLLGPGGTVIASGIINEREDETAAGLASAGLAVEEIRRKRGWTALLARVR